MRVLAVALLTAALVLLTIACEEGAETPTPTITVTATPRATPTPTAPLTPAVTPTPDFPVTPTPSGIAQCTSSTAADRLVGQTACVRVASVDASYRSDVSGQPTFLNDAPYPNHTFTAVIWGDNRGSWSTPPEQLYDGKCVDFTGLVTSYRGKPQIELTGPSQASFCQ